MDVVDFSKYLYNKLREREENLSSALAHGSVKSWEEYKMTVGEIRGLSLAREEIKALLENNADYDEDTLRS
jgi:hypothetical protein|tara:strand:+ start:729 stop:941 length:213 start_codon:yes stop_codon:yes gene_type:complete